jgi:hypothetical protein
MPTVGGWPGGNPSFFIDFHACPYDLSVVSVDFGPARLSLE